MMNGDPLFSSKTGLDMLIEIFKILGTPSKT